nr:unknown [uncultured organism]
MASFTSLTSIPRLTARSLSADSGWRDPVSCSENLGWVPNKITI